MVNSESNSNLEFQQQVLLRLEDLKRSDDELQQNFKGLRQEVDGMRQEVERFNEKFSNYQQAIQWVVQLAFTLIASATVTIIIMAIFKR